MLYDDTGLAAWSPFGGRIEMPTMDRLAENGLTYSQWHTTALCGPTRSCFLTGRNHHQNSFATIAETATGFPGNNTHIPMENAFQAEVLREHGCSTYWVGKNHNIPVDEFDMGSSKRNWPLARGFDRFYGFIGGEANQWYPDLVEDNHYVDQPYLPEEGYHLSKDLADKALEMIRTGKQSQPDKPWYMHFCPGANHAPHHAPQEFIDKYKGEFDDGYEAYREWVLPRMIERGILPEGTELTPINPMSPETAAPARRGAAVGHAVRRREAAVQPHGRGLRRLQRVHRPSGRADRRLPGGVGAARQHADLLLRRQRRLGRGQPERLGQREQVHQRVPRLDRGEPGDDRQARHARDLQPLPDRLGGRRSRRRSGCSSATATRAASATRSSIHWPAGMQARGEVRGQYHHCTDIVPTIYECCGITPPDTVLGFEQSELPGVSMRYCFDDADAPTTKETQYYEMLGTRGIWHKGWKAVTEHAPMPSGKGHFDQDRWQLFHTDEDRSEAHDLAEQHPEKVKELVDLWFAEAEKYDVLPLNDLGVLDYIKYEFQAAVPKGGAYTYFPGTAEVPERSAANVHGVSYKILADVEITDPSAQGVILAQGSRFGGHALFIKDGRLHYVYNFLGIKPEQHLESEPLEPGTHVLGVEFAKERPASTASRTARPRSTSTTTSSPRAPLRTQSGHFALCGEGLSVGRDTGDSVSERYTPYFPFEGGTDRQGRGQQPRRRLRRPRTAAQAALARD